MSNRSSRGLYSSWWSVFRRFCIYRCHGTQRRKSDSNKKKKKKETRWERGRRVVEGRHSGHGVDTDDRGKNVIPRIGMLDRKRIEWTKQRSLWQNRLNCDCNRREERGNRPHTVISQRRITFSRQGKRGTLGQYTGNHGEINRFRGNHRAPQVHVCTEVEFEATILHGFEIGSTGWINESVTEKHFAIYNNSVSIDIIIGNISGRFHR